MVISDEIEDAIEEFHALHGREPARLRLGRLQMAALKSFAEYYSMGPPLAGSPSFTSSRGLRLPIDESRLEDELTLV
jgi:hypothetical protein